ncbi:hypothetical protein BCIN_06g07010 [Botrytis cinerea B05.10]|uniref:Carbohydrate esterase family 5 protein n=3 Tax=Botryotinia fuckeliana TaxID=40559 RepID=A0A384JLN6_BOTFB|nr:hypothetical protein BCIN_06g07010 [Botrytis cinerea B05.10]ATZ51287.1 hypothetical protein BCIN_06g07010 [Botrytis cinerea B05.10]EMR90955.1 putative carbohydrate esterase family 5 protein [Botrytis cinerea BcDW1]CCD43014.1 carbohydrate esterase family 5 protein [Botrytis cinerea T4]
MLTSFTTSLILVLPALAAARITHQSRALVNSTACAPVHLILARGTTEGYPGTLKTLAELITDANPGTDYESVIYPATDETSTNSYAEGLLAARNQFTAYAELCEDSKIVFLAYSQGAMVVGDMLAGGGGDTILGAGNGSLPISSKIGDRMTALVLYGDPRHIPNESFDVGNNNVTGKYPRTASQISVIENQYSSKIADYCNIGDPVCASGNNITAHGVYPQTWDTTAAAWVQTILDG